MADVEPLRATATVDLAPDAAFELFTAGFGSWWPAEFSWSQPELLQSVGMECREGGILSETGPHGFRIDWGRVISWHPPASLTFLWQISAARVPIPDPSCASVVTVFFSGADEGTRVELTHGEWERHGSGAQAYRDDFSEAWSMALERFRQAAQAEGSALMDEGWIGRSAPRCTRPAGSTTAG